MAPTSYITALRFPLALLVVLIHTQNKIWQAETTFQTYDWNPYNPGIPDLPPSDKFVGDLFD